MGKKVDTLIISDLHLGSKVSRPRELLAVLEDYQYDRLIMLGDIFDDLNFTRLKSSHWDFLSYIRWLSNPKRDVEVVWVEGNHDEGLSIITSHLMGIKVHKEYSWEHDHQKYLAIHGHQFDKFIVDHEILTNVACTFYDWIQKCDTKQKKISRYLKTKSKTFMRNTDQVAQGAAKYGVSRKADVVFCGHTHHADNLLIDSIDYYNTGCWTDIPSTFVTINGKGVDIHEVE